SPYRRVSLRPGAVVKGAVAVSCAGAFVALLSSCTTDQTRVLAPSGRAARAASQRRPAGVPARVRPEEQPFADLARSAPSTAGFIFDPQGNLVVFVRDSLDRPLASLGLRGVLADKAFSFLGEKRNAPIIIRPVDFSFNELSTWRDLIADSVFDVLP